MDRERHPRTVNASQKTEKIEKTEKTERIEPEALGKRSSHLRDSDRRKAAPNRHSFDEYCQTDDSKDDYSWGEDESAVVTAQYSQSQAGQGSVSRGSVQLKRPPVGRAAHPLSGDFEVVGASMELDTQDISKVARVSVKISANISVG